MGLVHALLIFLILGLLSSHSNAANFNIVKPVHVHSLGGRFTWWRPPSRRGQSWSFDVPAGTANGSRIWGRTNCSLDVNGHGSCASGDCNGLLKCTGYGSPPNTISEYALNQFNTMEDLFDISLVDGFNIPMEFSPTTTSGSCQGTKCADPSILSQCPAQLKAPGGCNNPCTVFKTNEYCCTQGSCEPKEFSKFFKARCPYAYVYPEEDDQNSVSQCPGGTNYKVTFCP